MSKKDCGHHDGEKEKLVRLILYAIVGLIVVVLLIIFLFWVITRPSKPSFVLQDATLYSFNLSTGSAPNLLSTNLQVTISSRNPNGKIGIYYQRVDIYASYRNQQITLATLLPVTYQGHKDITVWSPFLYGSSIPVSPYVATALSQDLNAGMVLLNVKVDGRIKWKVGTWVSGRYHLHVNCPAYITFGDKSKGMFTSGAAVKFQLVQSCTVDV